MTTGRGLGMGLGVGADFGRGTVGARLAAAWLRGERQSDDTGIGQYTGELTLDLNKRGQVHPVFGVGFGVARVNKPEGSGNVGIGIARFGLEYSLGLEDTDVRLGGGITGVLPGPADREVSDVKPYALVGANVAIGF
ncbi:hypothetical protein LZC95_10900 [Pendulispora brunnea]|uniref:Uncharacterized protein n=1 Tax=Pendulispora brunnea TaxID=2905690 RepID=A0ABZ2KJ43_9BACT